MKYYTINKNNKLIGIGCSVNIPDDCNIFNYVKITKIEYNKLNKKEFNGK